MLYEGKLLGSLVSLRSVEMEDCDDRYLSWMHDVDTNRYMETRWSVQTIESIRSFVSAMRMSKNCWLFAIIYQGQHVGNIKIGPVHPVYRNADISYFIGEKDLAGKGIASEAVSLIVRFAFDILNLHRLQAGVFDGNFASRRVLEKNGFSIEAVFKEKYFLTSEEDWVDCFEYVLLKKDWLDENR